MIIDLSLQTSLINKNQVDFNKSTWFITDLYLKCLGRYELGEYKKAIVIVAPVNTRINPIERLVDVITVTISLDFNSYAPLPEHAKAHRLLEILQLGLLELAKYLACDSAPLQRAFDCCISKSIRNEWLRKNKLFQSPDRKHFAGVWCHWNMQKFEITTVFYNKRKEEIKRVKLIEIEPHLVEPLGKMYWDASSESFYVLSKDGKQSWEAKIN